MLYLAIDQHRKQLTVNMRNENGDILLKRQVSTEWKRVREFLGDVQQQSQTGGGFVAILEVCGFNEWLLKLLKEYGCRETILVQPEKRSKKKTDRRDANALGEILWVNRSGSWRASVSRGSAMSTSPASWSPRTGESPGGKRPGTVPHADHQQDQAHSPQAQPGAGVSHEGYPNASGRAVAAEVAAGSHRPLGDGPTPRAVEVVRRADGPCGGRDRRYGRNGMR